MYLVPFLPKRRSVGHYKCLSLYITLFIIYYQYIFPSEALSRKYELVNRNYKHIIIRIMQHFHSVSIIKKKELWKVTLGIRFIANYLRKVKN